LQKRIEIGRVTMTFINWKWTTSGVTITGMWTQIKSKPDGLLNPCIVSPSGVPVAQSLHSYNHHNIHFYSIRPYIYDYKGQRVTVHIDLIHARIQTIPPNNKILLRKLRKWHDTPTTALTPYCTCFIWLLIKLKLIQTYCIHVLDIWVHTYVTIDK